MKHTPGPWVAHGLAITTEMPVKHHTIPRDSALRVVGCAQWNDAPQWDSDRTGADEMNMPDYSEAKANARIMAASLELLAELEWLTDSVSEGLESPEAWDHALPDILHGLERSREAIQKAKG